MSLNDEIKIADFGLAQFSKSMVTGNVENSIKQENTFDSEMTSGVGTLF